MVSIIIHVEKSTPLMDVQGQSVAIASPTCRPSLESTPRFIATSFPLLSSQ
ncbi:hypothetical protein Pfo_016374, partial [Paulownia fortunei]